MECKSLLECVYGNTRPDEYGRMFEAEFGERPGKFQIKKDTKVHNPKESEHTSDRRAYLDYPWIKYWQAFTGNYSNKLQCACCGKNIYIDEESAECIKDVQEQNKGKNQDDCISKDDLKAVGAHLYANGIDTSDGYCIVPMCKEHNAKSSDVTMSLSKDVIAVEELKAHLK